MDHLQTALADRASVAVSVLVVLAGVLAFTYLLGGSSDVPLVGKELGGPRKRRQAFFKSGLELYVKGFSSFKDKAYRLTTLDGDRFVLPRTAMEELRNLPDNVLSTDKALDVITQRRHLSPRTPKQSHFLVHIIRNDLTQNLVRLAPKVNEESALAIEKIIGPCEEWTSVAVFGSLLRIVASVSGVIFIGPEDSRSPQYLGASIGFALCFFEAGAAIKQWFTGTRWLGRYLTPKVWKLWIVERRAKQFFRPLIEKRRKAMQEGKALPDDALQWMMNKAEKMGVSDSQMVECQLTMSMAAIHTTTQTVVQCLYDLVVRPDLIEELRKEIADVLTNHDGELCTKALFDMKLLDSVMKESMRTHPGNLVRFQRWANEPITLKDGTRVPAGYMIETPHALTIQDPNIYANPETFDARRWSNYREGTGEDLLNYTNKEQYQFVSVTKDFMHFGYGRHACPGRFFAATEIKMILVRLLLEYDISMPVGIPNEPSMRYADMRKGTYHAPDPTKKIMMRKRRD